jgi:cyanophycinase
VSHCEGAGSGAGRCEGAGSGAARPAGPVALAGSGEFLPVMAPVDRALLQGRPPRAAFLPTAAALEGDERVAYWLDLGREHYLGMGIEPVPVDVRTRHDAEDPALAALVDGVGLVYLSGGDPHHLCATLAGTKVWAAVADAWRGGAALAGCSAGAMALTAGAPELPGRLVGPPELPGRRSGPPERPGRRPAVPSHGAGAVVDGRPNGLGVVPGLAVMPHFDMIERWRPGAAARFAAWHPPGTTLVGIEENTALVSAPGGGWRVAGEGAVWVLRGEARTKAVTGDVLDLPGPDPR